jgi:pimeloyl-ACP methyl ester carboxylesterase
MDTVDQIKTPTMIVVGDSDLMTPLKYSTYLKDKIKGSIMHVIEDAGHLVMFEKFGVFNELVANWVSGLN